MEAKYEDYDDEIYRLNDLLKERQIELAETEREYKERIEEIEIKYEE